MKKRSKLALITGGGRGIGRAIALQLAEAGYGILLTYKSNEQVAKQLCTELSAQGCFAQALYCDLALVSNIEALFARIQIEYGGLEVLVNNAGISNTLSIDEIDEAEWNQMLDTNLRAVFFCSKFAFQMMREQRHGRIISLASIAGQRGGFFSAAHYTASKGGVISLMKSFALAGAEFNITANCVSPGVVATDMAIEEGLTSTGIPMQRMAKPEEVAHAVAFLASDQAAYMTGLTLDVNGGQLMR